MAPGRRRVVTGLALGLALPMASCAPPPGSARKTDITTIGGVSYRLPDGAFADGVIEHGPRDSLLLALMAPAAGRFPAMDLQVLLVASSASDARTRAQDVQADIATGASVAASLDPRRRADPLRKSARRVPDAPVGLVQVATDTADSLGDDVFVRPPITHPSEFVACSRLGPSIVSPLCSQEFAGPGIRVKASYPRGFLAKWEYARTFVLSYLSHRQEQ